MYARLVCSCCKVILWCKHWNQKRDLDTFYTLQESQLYCYRQLTLDPRHVIRPLGDMWHPFELSVPSPSHSASIAAHAPPHQPKERTRTMLYINLILTKSEDLILIDFSLSQLILISIKFKTGRSWYQCQCSHKMATATWWFGWNWFTSFSLGTSNIRIQIAS